MIITEVGPLRLGILIITLFFLVTSAAFCQTDERVQAVLSMVEKARTAPVTEAPAVEKKPAVIEAVMEDDIKVSIKPAVNTGNKPEAAQEAPTAARVAPPAAKEPVKEDAKVLAVSLEESEKPAQAVKESEPEQEVKQIVEDKGRPDKIAVMNEVEEVVPEQKSSGTVGTIFSTILKLAVVLLLAYGTILFLKWLSVKKEVLPKSTGGLKVVENLKLSQTSNLHVVEVRGKALLISSSNGQVNLIQELEGEAEVPAEAVSTGFAEYLEKYSKSSASNAPSSRISGLLRDCTNYLKNRCSVAPKAGAKNEG